MNNMEKHWKASANREYLGSWDLQTGTTDKGMPVYGELRATIASVKLDEQVIDMDKGGNAKKECSVIRFKENLKPMILNSTNKKAISSVSGSPVPKYWVGKTIIIYVETGIYMPGTRKADNITTDALRIRPFPPTKPVTYTCTVCDAKDVDETTAQYCKKVFGAVMCKKCGSKKKAEMESKGDAK